MKFGLIYELQLPRPWDQDSEFRMVHEALDQIELADKLGYDNVWCVEHHFMEEYSHSSAPEEFLAAAAMRTKDIRLGHGVVQIIPNFNHPAKTAGKIGMLDLLSNGRVEFGMGESTTDVELRAFGVDRENKKEIAEEMYAVIARMMTEEPFTGYEGRFFSMEPRNIIPKPRQKPHPPMWVACSKRPTILRAAKRALGVLSYSFLEPQEAKGWVDEYYDVLGREGVPVGFAPNANFAGTSQMMCCASEEEAIQKSIDGSHFFAYAIQHYVAPGNKHYPGTSDVWQEFLENRDEAGLSRDIIEATGEPLTAKVKKSWAIESEAEATGAFQQGTLESLRGAIGTPWQLTEYLQGFEEAGVDQMIFHVHFGNCKHEDICASLELFAKEVMPEFKDREKRHQDEKAKRLAPILEQVLARRPDDSPPLPEDYHVEASPYIPPKD